MTGKFTGEDQYTQPTRWCPQPGRWHAQDADSTEIEVSILIAAFGQALKVDEAIETGAAFGLTSKAIGAVMKSAGHGTLTSFETDPERVKRAREEVAGLPVAIVEQSSIEGLRSMQDDGFAGKVGFAFLDSSLEARPVEFELVIPLLGIGGVVAVHDCGMPGSAKFPKFSERMWELARSNGFTGIALPTPRGVSFFVKERW